MNISLLRPIDWKKNPHWAQALTVCQSLWSWHCKREGKREENNSANCRTSKVQFSKSWLKAMDISLLRPIDWNRNVVQHWSQKVHKGANRVSARFLVIVIVIVTVVMMVTVMMILGVDSYLFSIVLTGATRWVQKTLTNIFKVKKICDRRIEMSN